MTATPTSTSIRVSTSNRDRLNDLAADRSANVDDTIRYLLDEDWKRRCIADSDRLREQDPAGWREYMSDAEAWNVTLADGLADAA